MSPKKGNCSGVEFAVGASVKLADLQEGIYIYIYIYIYMNFKTKQLRETCRNIPDKQVGP